MKKLYDIFISYSKEDIDVVNKICAALDNHSISYFIDRQSGDGDMKYPDIIANAILQSKLFLYVASKNSNKSEFTNSEITFAFNEKSHNSILPYVIDNSTLPASLRFAFSTLTLRNIKDHPIETTLVNDICSMIKGEYVTKVITKKEPGPQKMSPSEMTKIGDNYYDGNGVEKNYAEAVKWYRKAAEQGFADAQNKLGDCYYKGEGVNANFAEAVKWFRKGAEQGYPKAQFSLSNCYSIGDGVKRNLYEAGKWYDRAVKTVTDYAAEQINLGDCYFYGNGVEEDLNEAKKYYREVAEQILTDYPHVYTRADYAKKQLEILDEIVEWYTAAIKGDAIAQCKIADIYFHKCDSSELDKSRAAAAKWYRKAAEQGYAAAQLGLYYSFGCDSTDGFNWLSKAVEQGYAEAEYALGCYYDYYGKDVKAVKWFRKAAKQGYVDAQLHLGLCYSAGIGAAGNHTEAVKWYRKAAEQGNAEAQYKLGNSYYMGEGVKEDYDKAVKWYRKAAKQGYADAKRKLKYLREDI